MTPSMEVFRVARWASHLTPGGLSRGPNLVKIIINEVSTKLQAELQTAIPQRIEPKTFFANERTFLSWLHMAVTIGSIGAALLGFSGASPRSPHASPVVRLPGPMPFRCLARLFVHAGQDNTHLDGGSQCDMQFSLFSPFSLSKAALLCVCAERDRCTLSLHLLQMQCRSDIIGRIGLMRQQLHLWLVNAEE